ncbi:MAG: hypothetical protein ACREBU_16245, partial [Nitrososphaera sp.]
NDRGKALTVLEKSKPLLLEYDLNECEGQFASRIYEAFGRLYHLLDQGIRSELFSEGEKGDGELMQLISTYIQIGESPDAPHQGAEVAYQYFREKLAEAERSGDIGSVEWLLNRWLVAIDEIIPHLQQLNNYLSGHTDAPKSTSPSYICQERTVGDDYNIIIRSLGLSPRSLAMLIKFRHLYGLECHERLPLQLSCDPR